MKSLFFYVSYLILTILFKDDSYAALAQNAPNTLPVIKPVNFQANSFNIQRYGAKPDGVTLNTISIQAAIDDCNIKGGGEVIVPAGRFFTGTIFLK